MGEFPEKILVIDDDPAALKAISAALGEHYRLTLKADPEEGLKSLQGGGYSLVLLELQMPERDGIWLLGEIKGIYPSVEVIMMTGNESIEIAKKAIRYGAIDYLIKPLDVDEVLRIVEKAFGKIRLDRLKVKKEAQREALLTLTETMRMELFDNASDGILITDTEGRIVDINKRACSILGRPKESLIGKYESDKEISPLRILIPPRQQSLLAGESLLFETVTTNENGDKVFLEISSKALSPDGTNVLIQSFLRDVTEKKRLEYLAHLDPLTEVYNKVHFLDECRARLHSARHADSSMAVLYLDLDDFKKINDTYGHGVGDIILQGAAKRMKICLREDDIIGRIGEDEFSMLLAGFIMPEGAKKVCERILQEVLKPFNVDDGYIRISLSIGIAMFPADGHDIETLLRSSDYAMYMAKRKGKNRFMFHQGLKMNLG